MAVEMKIASNDSQQIKFNQRHTHVSRMLYIRTAQDFAIIKFISDLCKHISLSLPFALARCDDGR